MNPLMKETCECCGQQILSYNNIGLGSYFDKNDENPDWDSYKAYPKLKRKCAG